MPWSQPGSGTLLILFPSLAFPLVGEFLVWVHPNSPFSHQPVLRDSPELTILPALCRPLLSPADNHCVNLWDLDSIGPQPSPSKNSLRTCLGLKSITQILFFILARSEEQTLRRSLLFAAPRWDDVQHSNYCTLLSWK